ncbi:MAG TPA: hypothetical protein VHD56_06670 [Tepidisphaeraceae bacterium]|nr:hypothetical protein [Tepidisphaeraceae bacterium]
MSDRKPLVVCGGSPSSGSTLVAWCFLQRSDMDGVLDARNDYLPDMPVVTTPKIFFKMTISVFRLSEMLDHYSDEGYVVQPLLVVRDMRSIFNSILSKPYTSNATTAEDPPLRMRLRRFKEDWLLCRDRNWPIIRYESLVPAEGEKTLRQACSDMGLEWDQAMLDWPKAKAEMADPAHGSPTLRRSMGRNFAETADPKFTKVKVDRIPPLDLEWLEGEFAEFNRVHNYAEHIEPAGRPADAPQRAVPLWENSRRSRKERPMARLSAAYTRLKNKMLNRQAGSSI